MNSQQAGFAVLSTPVALCDRRALSEAWFSALHLHKDQVPTTGARALRTIDSPGRNQINIARQGAALPPPAQRLSLAVRVGAATALAGAPAAERRLFRSKLAKKIERAFLKPKVPPRHASFSLEGDRGRVQILLRDAGEGTQIVALCPPGAREVVAQALAQARYALAMRGINLHAEVRGFAR